MNAITLQALDSETISAIEKQVESETLLSEKVKLEIEKIEARVDLKKKYAEAILRNPKNSYQAANEVFPDNVQAATYITQNWANSQTVEKLKQDLLDEFGKDYFLPDREDVAREIYERSIGCRSMDDFAKGMRLYCDVRGFIEKQGNNSSVNIQLNNNVMQIPVADQSTWENEAIAQQENLKAICIEQTAKRKAETDDS